MGSRKGRKPFTELRNMLNSMGGDGTLEAGLGQALEKPLKQLDHALKLGKPRMIRSAVDKVARVLVERMVRKKK